VCRARSAGVEREPAMFHWIRVSWRRHGSSRATRRIRRPWVVPRPRRTHA
jgi:hypothetical protein